MGYTPENTVDEQSKNPGVPTLGRRQDISYRTVDPAGGMFLP
jgi:hypothetical protein